MATPGFAWLQPLHPYPAGSCKAESHSTHCCQPVSAGALVSLAVPHCRKSICSIFCLVVLLKVDLLPSLSSQTGVRTIAFWNMSSKYMLWVEDVLMKVRFRGW